MDASNVLKEYLELFTADCRQLKLLLAPNAVVDWFGRQVRGPAKIHDYLRFEVGLQYDHANFDKAEVCAPIEQRPSHWKTKSVPTGDMDFILPLNKVTRLTSLKRYADSDLEDDDLEIQPLPSCNQTPDHQGNCTSHLNELTPPSSTIKLENVHPSDSESDLEEGEDATAPKRLKRSLPTPFSYLRRLPTSMNKITHVSKRQSTVTQLDVQMQSNDTSSDEELDADIRNKLVNEYTPLYYIEATGMLRAKQQLLNYTDEPPTPHRINDWDRPVRLRISYRRCLSDQQIQIALVIYEHINSSNTDVSQSEPVATTAVGMRRRNLMAQFNEAALNEQSPATLEVADDIEGVGSTEIALRSNDDEEASAISAVQFHTPTKSAHTPPATPKRRPRVPYAMSGMRNINSTPSTSTTKRGAARTLRL
ncbi:uncharacterized protein LOC129238806 [Anastrepha obliqua]|uniref:uncharacterized protein LOC129238806 n=1 Tax=Anastrepha obliqua TaxID=95512 RepID=UPI00240A3105|nr:uncharacterized protein LOC129238806 [Anastrepha obliqua]